MYLNLDISMKSWEVIRLKQNNDRVLTLNIYDNGSEYNLTGSAITLKGKNQRGEGFTQSTNITTNGNEVTIKLNRDFTRVPGKVNVEATISKNSNSVSTFTFFIEVEQGVLESANNIVDGIASDVIEALDVKISEATKVKNDTEKLINSGGAATKIEVDAVNSKVQLTIDSINEVNNIKVDKVPGETLTPNKYTSPEKSKVATIDTKMDKGASIEIAQIDLTKGKIKEEHLDTTLIQKIAGTAPISQIPADNSVGTEKYINNSISVHKLLNAEVQVVTKTIEFNTTTKILTFVHPTYAIIDNLTIKKGVNITTLPIIFDLSTKTSTIFLIVYDYFAKTLNVKPITEALTVGDKVILYYYKGDFFGINALVISYICEGEYVFKSANEILNDKLNNPFIANVNVKILGDSITAGVGATGYGVSTEAIGTSTKFVPSQDSKCWANLLGKRIVNLFSGSKTISPTDPKIEYLNVSSKSIQKSKNCKLFAYVSCQVGIKFDIKATQFNLYFLRNTGSAIVDIKVDGVLKKTVDLYSAVTEYGYVVNITGLDNSNHSVEVNYKDKNPASVSTRINFEGIEVTRNITYKNMGVSGVDSEWIDYYRTDLIKNDDDIIIIQIGTNDRLDFNDVSALELYLGNTIEYIKTLKKDVILLSSCPAEKTMENLKFTMSDVDLAIKRISKAYGITHISNYKGMQDYCNNRGVKINSLLGDKLHPNDDGYDVMYINTSNEIGIPVEPIEL